MSRIKGSRWIAVNEYFTQVAGPDALIKILNAMNDEDRVLFQKPILPVTWIDYHAYMRWVFTADQVLGKGDNKLIEGSSFYTAQRHFRGIYKIFIRFSNPEYIISRAGEVWRQYVDCGKLVPETVGEKHIHLVLTDIPDIPLHHEISHNPFYEEILRVAGAKNPKVTHPQCIARGDKVCLWDGTWE